MKLIKVLLFLLLNFSASAIEVGDTTTDIILKHIDHNENFSTHGILQREKSHKYIVLEFLASYCRVCQNNMIPLSKLAAQNSDVATFTMVGVDRSEDDLIDYNFTYSDLTTNIDMALDTGKIVKKSFGVYATPTTFILDQNNVVVYKHMGTFDDQDRQEITDLLHE